MILQERQMTLTELDEPVELGHSLMIDHSFPEKFADELARREVFNKHLFRPNTYLHKWWARRCGTMFRSILKQFVPVAESRDYYAPRGLEGKTVLDPMMGGGTTLHEAIRLGANVIGADIDPIPIVQARASLSYAALEDLRTAFNHFHARLYDSLGHYFVTECPTCQKIVDIQYTLHGVRKACGCREVVQIDQYDLRHEADRTISISPYDLSIRDDYNEEMLDSETLRLITKSETQCQNCGHTYHDLLDLPFYKRYSPIAIVAACVEHGIFFRAPDDTDRQRIKQADESRLALDMSPIEDFRVSDGPKAGDLLKRNIHSYLDLFSSRQLLYIHESTRQLHEFGGVEKLNLAMLVSASLEFNSMLCGYKGWYKRRPGAIRHVFALHAYSFPYTALENNPINPNKSSGNLQLLFRDRVERGRKWATLPIERKIGEDGKSQLVKMPGELDAGLEVFDQSALAHERQKFWLIYGDSQNLPVDSHSVDLIVTDPPYYDSVQYSDLAAFFRVWLARLLPDELEWSYDESQSAVATNGTNRSGSFVTALSGIFAECARVLKNHTGRMVFTFHHWDPAAWAELTIALKAVNFRLVNSYTVYSEHPISVHIRDLNAITHDSILVFAFADSNHGTQWTLPTSIDTNDSETFCRQCSETLGWLLDSRLSLSEIRMVWNELIQEKNGDR